MPAAALGAGAEVERRKVEEAERKAASDQLMKTMMAEAEEEARIKQEVSMKSMTSELAVSI